MQLSKGDPVWPDTDRTEGSMEGEAPGTVSTVSPQVPHEGRAAIQEGHRRKT